MADIITMSDSDKQACSGVSSEANMQPPGDEQQSSTKSSSVRPLRRSSRLKARSSDVCPGTRSLTCSSSREPSLNHRWQPEDSSNKSSKRPRLEEMQSVDIAPSTPDNQKTQSRSRSISTSRGSRNSKSGASDRSVQMIFSDTGSNEQTPLTPPSTGSGSMDIFWSGGSLANVLSPFDSPSPCERKNRGINSLAREDGTENDIKSPGHDASTQTDDLDWDEPAINQAEKLHVEVSCQSDDPTPDDLTSNDPEDPETKLCEICEFSQANSDITDEAVLDLELRDKLLDGPKKSSEKKKKEEEKKEEEKKEEEEKKKEAAKSAEPKYGVNYIFFRESHEGFVKLGSSKDAKTRKQAVERDSPRGKNSAGEWIDDILPGHSLESVQSTMPIQHYEFVERLLQKELYNIRRRLHYTNSSLNPGGCTEWFEISADVATEVRNKWVDWIDTYEPYDAEGKIKPFWRERIKNCGLYHKQRHKRSLHARWLKVLKPSLYARCRLFYMESGKESHTIAALLLKDALQLVFHTNIFVLPYAFYFFFTYLIYKAWLPGIPNIPTKDRGMLALVVGFYTLFIYFYAQARCRY